MQRSRPYRFLRRRPACANSRFEVFFDTIEDADGRVTEDFLIIRPRTQAENGVAGICVLPEVNGRIGLMRGYRHQLDQEVWQAPAGFVEPGEEPATTALRELEEETQMICAASDLKSLGSFLPDAGLIEGRVALFVASRARLLDGADAPQREVGTGALRMFERDELVDLVREAGDIGGSTLAACLRYLVVTKPSTNG